MLSSLFPNVSSGFNPDLPFSSLPRHFQLGQSCRPRVWPMWSLFHKDVCFGRSSTRRTWGEANVSGLWEGFWQPEAAQRPQETKAPKGFERVSLYVHCSTVWVRAHVWDAGRHGATFAFQRPEKETHCLCQVWEAVPIKDVPCKPHPLKHFVRPNCVNGFGRGAGKCEHTTSLRIDIYSSIKNIWTVEKSWCWWGLEKMESTKDKISLKQRNIIYSELILIDIKLH